MGLDQGWFKPLQTARAGQSGRTAPQEAENWDSWLRYFNEGDSYCSVPQSWISADFSDLARIGLYEHPVFLNRLLFGVSRVEPPHYLPPPCSVWQPLLPQQCQRGLGRPCALPPHAAGPGAKSLYRRFLVGLRSCAIVLFTSGLWAIKTLISVPVSLPQPQPRHGN